MFYFLSSCGGQVVIGVCVNPGITSVFQGESMIILQGQFSLYAACIMENAKANRNIITSHTGTHTVSYTVSHTHTYLLSQTHSALVPITKKAVQFDL